MTLRWTQQFIVPVIVAAFAGCSSLGPAGIDSTRDEYNAAIQRTNAEEMLLDLVRIRYRESPLFLQVSDLSNQWDLTRNIDASLLFVDEGDREAERSLGGGFSYSDTPTVTMTPLQGEEFVQRVLQPVALETLLLLYHSGWPIDSVLRLTAERLNGIQNAPTASGATPEQVPTYADFLTAVRLLRRLQLRGVIELGYQGEEGERVPVLRIASHASDWPEVREFRAILGLDPDATLYRITAETATRDPGQIGISTRSLTGMMAYLSQSIVPPQKDVRDGLVRITRRQNGEPFAWSELLGDLFEVRSATSRPDNAAVAVRYRDQWFYILDSDLVSKSTFMLLQQLFALQAGAVPQTGPVLTLPVGR